MKSPLASLASRGLCLLSLASLPAAHGGNFLAPPAPPTPGAPRTPTPGRGLPARFLPAAARAKAQPPPRPVVSTTRQSTILSDFTEWSWWWEFNKEPFLDLKRQLFTDRPVTGAQRTDASVDPRHTSPRQIREIVIPALLRALESDDSTDLTSACIIALARLGVAEGGADAGHLRASLVELLKHKEQEVSETAVVGLGILGAPAGAFTLSEILLDSKEGRKLVGRTGKVPLRSRAFAAYGMALLGETESEDLRRFLVHRIVKAFEDVDDSPPDIGVACIMAMGRIPLGDAPLATAGATKKDDPVILTRGEQIRWLLDILDDKKIDRILRAHVPTSLAYLLNEPGLDGSRAMRNQVITRMIELLEDSRTPREILQGCAQAIGLIADASSDPVDMRARMLLMDFDKKVSDPAARHFALLGLGRVAATASDDPMEIETQNELRRVLLRKVASPGSSRARWGFLSLALLEHQRALDGKVPFPIVSDAILDTLGRVSSPSDVGVLAISAGLLRDPKLEDVMLSKFEKIGEDRAKGYLAIGLGMIGSHKAKPKLEEILDKASYRPELMSDVAIGLGILGDPTIVPKLIESLADARSVATQSPLAQALGRIGDRSAVVPLVALLESDRDSQLARAFAAVALGRMADLDPLPWNTRLSVDVLYPSPTTTLFDEAGFGILNLL